MKEEEFLNTILKMPNAASLIVSFIKGTLTPLERKELDAWILESEVNEVLFDELTNEENIEKTMRR